jgi:hypothetical protein
VLEGAFDMVLTKLLLQRNSVVRGATNLVGLMLVTGVACAQGSGLARTLMGRADVFDRQSAASDGGHSDSCGERPAVQ